MGKKLDLSRSVYDLTKQYPELIDIMVGLGFSYITKKFLLNSVGKLVTIPKGAAMRGIDMTTIVTTLMAHGFELEGEAPQSVSPVSAPEETHADRTNRLKSYLKRLGEGEDLEQVRKEFAENFSQVEASEIMQAEQELMAEGVPLEEVQRLCDVHSALFHGATGEEQTSGSHSGAGHAHNHDAIHAIAEANSGRAADLSRIDGHPIQTLMRENAAMEALLNEAFGLEDREQVAALLPRLREIAIHYARIGDLLYPHLKVKYDISGPSQVMWTIDDEIRNEMGILARKSVHDELWWGRLQAVLTRAKEMLYKENNILLPICAANFTQAEWQHIYRDGKDYAVCLGVEPLVWAEAERNETSNGREGEIVMPGGHLTLAQLTAMLNTIPLEITFVDADNINRYFNEGPKVLKRPSMAIDREVFSCHPPTIEPMVRSIIDDLRSGKRDQVQMWMEKLGRTMLVNYMAVRDKAGNYVGTVEVVQDMEFAKQHFLR